MLQDGDGPLTGLPLELLEGILTYLDVRSLLQCRLVNRRWKNLIDGDEATGQPPSALFQGMMAAAFTQLSSPSATDTSHPGHDYRRVIARNAAWMHRDFAAALRSAIDGSHDLRQEPAFSFNVKALMFHLTGKKRWSADDLEPELHGGHLFMSLRSPGVHPRPDDFGILHVDLNKADPAVLRRFQSGQPPTGVAGESADGADRLVGVCWRPWSEEPEAWGFSQARNEVIVVCAAHGEVPGDRPVNRFVEIHVLHSDTLLQKQPSTIHFIPFARPWQITSFKLVQNRIIMGMLGIGDGRTLLVQFDLHPAPKMNMALSPPLQVNFRLQPSPSLAHNQHRDWHWTTFGFQDAAWLSQDLLLVAASAMGEDLPEGSEGCNLDVYHVRAEVPVLLARLPIVLKFIPNIPRHLVNLAEVDEIKVSAEPNAESPIFLMIGWAYRAVLEVHGRMESRRDRLFVSRGPLLAAAQRQLEALASGFAFPILLDEFSPSPSPMFTTLNNSSMHVSHRSRCIGLACQHVLGGLVQFNNQPHPAVGPRDSVIPDGTILTITQVLPARHLHDLKHHPQRQKWLGLAESSSLEGSSAMMPIPADGRHPSQETARSDSPHPPELEGGSVVDDRAASPSDYLALCRHIDLSGILDTRDNDEDLAMDDDRLVIRYNARRSAGLTVAVLPVQGPR